VLHLSAAVLTSTDNEETMLFTKHSREPNICIAMLSAGHEIANLDLFIN
jgi:hypothetical protein